MHRRIHQLSCRRPLHRIGSAAVSFLDNAVLQTDRQIKTIRAKFGRRRAFSDRCRSTVSALLTAHYRRKRCRFKKDLTTSQAPSGQHCRRPFTDRALRPGKTHAGPAKTARGRSSTETHTDIHIHTNGRKKLQKNTQRRATNYRRRRRTDGRPVRLTNRG